MCSPHTRSVPFCPRKPRVAKELPGNLSLGHILALVLGAAAERKERGVLPRPVCFPCLPPPPGTLFISLAGSLLRRIEQGMPLGLDLAVSSRSPGERSLCLLWPSFPGTRLDWLRALQSQKVETVFWSTGVPPTLLGRWGEASGLHMRFPICV